MFSRDLWSLRDCRHGDDLTHDGCAVAQNRLVVGAARHEPGVAVDLTGNTFTVASSSSSAARYRRCLRCKSRSVTTTQSPSQIAASIMESPLTLEYEELAATYQLAGRASTNLHGPSAVMGRPPQLSNQGNGYEAFYADFEARQLGQGRGSATVDADAVLIQHPQWWRGA